MVEHQKTSADHVFADHGNHEHRRVRKTDFEGKTVRRFEPDADNVWRFWFSDGSSFAVNSEIYFGGIPIMEVCDACT